jgi:hypothetical protein
MNVGKVITALSMSLDGFIAGPNDEIEPLHSAVPGPVKNINSSSLNIGYAYV